MKKEGRGFYECCVCFVMVPVFDRSYANHDTLIFSFALSSFLCTRLLFSPPFLLQELLTTCIDSRPKGDLGEGQASNQNRKAKK
jgi:hypothetical protein